MCAIHAHEARILQDASAPRQHTNREGENVQRCAAETLTRRRPHRTRYPSMSVHGCVVWCGVRACSLACMRPESPLFQLAAHEGGVPSDLGIVILYTIHTWMDALFSAVHATPLSYMGCWLVSMKLWPHALHVHRHGRARIYYIHNIYCHTRTLLGSHHLPCHKDNLIFKR